MKPYQIKFQSSVEKDLRKLSSENYDRLLSRIEELANEYDLQELTNLIGTQIVQDIKKHQG